LVLGGAGTGFAWEIGILAGLAEAGADLAGASLIAGTSAAPMVGVLLAAGLDVQQCYAKEVAPSNTASEIDFLRDGAKVIAVTPDRVTQEGMGRSLNDRGDPARRPGAARAGHAQAANLVDEIAQVWTTQLEPSWGSSGSESSPEDKPGDRAVTGRRFTWSPSRGTSLHVERA
jgi:predicted acylesterase/phospholipase RssA